MLIQSEFNTFQKLIASEMNAVSLLDVHICFSKIATRTTVVTL